jgi:hypothetical protein
MSLLREIQEEATKTDSDVLVLLRKCRVLASRIGNHDLKAWVQRELDGYESSDELPEYRKAHTISKGHFLGAFGRQLKNAEIPPRCLPEKYRPFASEANLRSGIGTYCDLLSGDKLKWTLSVGQRIGENKLIYGRGWRGRGEAPPPPLGLS